MKFLTEKLLSLRFKFRPLIFSISLIVGATIFASLLASCNHTNDEVIETSESAETNVATNTSELPETSGDTIHELKIGLLSPRSGSLGTYATGPLRAAELAAKEINEAGGNITFSHRDSGTNIEVATKNAKELLSAGVHGIVGPFSSSVSLGTIPTILSQNVVVISPAASTKQFTTYDDNGLLFRTVSSNQLWAKVTVDEILTNGHKRLAIVYRDDAFGNELAEGTHDRLMQAGVEVVQFYKYGTAEPDPIQIVRQIRKDDIDALFLVAFREGDDITRELINQGINPPDVAIYLSDRFRDLGNIVDPDDPGKINGIVNINPTPHPNADPSFVGRLSHFADDVTETPYNGSTYDAIVIMALASLVANSADPLEFSKEIVGVTRGGRKCTSYRGCGDLIERGIDIDYDGASSPLEFTDAGEPSFNSYKIFTYGENGQPGPERVVVITE